MEDNARKCALLECEQSPPEGRFYCDLRCKELDQKETKKDFYSTSEVLGMFGITKPDLYTILRPVRSQGKILAPIFSPTHPMAKTLGRWIFTQSDVEKLERYFRALREYKEAREELRSV